MRRVDSVSNVRVSLVPALSNQFTVHIFPVGIKYVLSPVVLLKGREEARSLLLLTMFRLLARGICCWRRGKEEQRDLTAVPHATARELGGGLGPYLILAPSVHRAKSAGVRVEEVLEKWRFRKCPASFSITSTGNNSNGPRASGTVLQPGLQ